MRAGGPRFALALAFCLPALGLIGTSAGLTGQGFSELGLAGLGFAGLGFSGLGTATLVATAMLVALCAVRRVAVPLVSGQVLPAARIVGMHLPAPIRSSDPDSPGAARPRAPGRGHTARPVLIESRVFRDPEGRGVDPADRVVGGVR
jgi:hypothetical protein